MYQSKMEALLGKAKRLTERRVFRKYVTCVICETAVPRTVACYNNKAGGQVCDECETRRNYHV